MGSIGGTIVTVNTGSSSIKLAVFAMNEHTLDELYTASISNIGQSVALLEITRPTHSAQTEEVSAMSHAEASHLIVKQLANVIDPNSMVAIGHRLVHGGIKYTDPTLIETITEADWDLLSRLDPGHTPAARQIIAQFTQFYPNVPEVACFDTAFFRDMPLIAKIVPIPRKYYAEGVRRYGFHGLSYASLLAKFREKAGDTAVNGRVVLAHLGSGASLAAIQEGKPIDTTMSFTPTSGIIMSTRSGDLDPNIFSFLHKQNGMSIDEFDRMVSSKSGLLGISQLTGDMHALLDLEKDNNDAAMAVERFILDVRKSIGALAATLGGIDSLIFSGGIGEQSAVLRARICEGLDYMGIGALNEDANAKNMFLVSGELSRVGVHVIRADEARVIASQVQELLTDGSRL